MSLATRCTACGTVFRIVEDQLRVSDGWVRCGRCSEVFDARELLFDIERETPPPWPAQYTPEAAPPPPAPLPPPPPALPPPPPPAPVAPPAFDPSPWGPDEPMRHEPPTHMPEPEIAAPPTDWGMPPADRHEPRWIDEDALSEPVAPPPPAAPPAPVAVRSDAEPAADGAAPAAASVPVPEFMRRARHQERWRKPGVIAALGASALLLGLLLLLQITLHFRHALAASHPALRDTLAMLCRPVGCDIQPWRRIDALGIDSTSLNPLGSNNSYKLNLALRNKTAVDVAAPWIELSLTDATGAPFARRVLGPETLTPPLKQVNAESEQTLSLVFSTGNQRVSGYSVNIFYP